MIELWVLGVLVVGFAALWLIGEARNLRSLRIAGILVPCLVIPFAYTLGEVVGHGRAMQSTAESIARFANLASKRIDDGNTELVHARVRLCNSTVRSTVETYGSLSPKPAVSQSHAAFLEMIEGLDTGP